MVLIFECASHHILIMSPSLHITKTKHRKERDVMNIMNHEDFILRAL